HRQIVFFACLAMLFLPCGRRTASLSKLDRPKYLGKLTGILVRFCTAHVRRYHRHYQSSGHIWQGRFKAFAIEQNEHLLTVLRYVERNALRANLVERAELWPWTSLHHWLKSDRPSYWHDGPV